MVDEITIPDAKAAALSHLRNTQTVIDIATEQNIRGTMPARTRTSNGFYVTATKIPGGNANPWVPTSSVTLELRCYGPSAYEAMKLSRAVQGAFIPYDRRSYGFNYHGCNVYDVRLRTGHAEFPEPGYDGNGDWDMVRTVYEFFFWETAP